MRHPAGLNFSHRGRSFLQYVWYRTMRDNYGNNDRTSKQRSFAVFVRSRRLDDRIRELCAKVVASTDPKELEVILPELRSALHQAIERIRVRSVAVLGGRRDFPNERRKTS